MAPESTGAPVEDNILAIWRGYGSPAYLNAGLRARLRERNALTGGELACADGTETFTLDRPGIALLEW